jgi:hypothetical protein
VGEPILDTSNRPIMIEEGVWWRQSHHQSLRDRKSFKVSRVVQSKGESL